MTTYTLFTPPRKTPFQFQPTLDGQVYNVSVTWNMFGQRWYLNLYDLNGNRLDTTSMVGSPDSAPVATQTWDVVREQVTVTTILPHAIPLGVEANLTVTGAFPPAYNTTAQMIAVSPTALIYSLEADPGGPATQPGMIVQNIPLFPGQYFQTSTLLYRESTGMFEVSP
jgi:hypothetical protein